jgi:hypothetical protein
MTSQINPNNVNTAYPVAGQDNSTQGFRDNFTNIKLNFTYAASEISALQNNVVYTGNVNDLGGGTLYDVTLQNNKYSTVNLSGAAPVANINYASGSYQSLTANANVVLNITNLPAPGTTAVLTLNIAAQAANSTASPYTVTIPGVSSTTSGLVGLSGNVLSFPINNSTTAGTHTYQLVTSDQGTNFTITPLQTTAQPFNSLSEDVANTAVVNLAKSDSYFSTSAAEVATLPAGVNGQVKVLAMYATSGNMVITVTNAGWKTSGTGTITFDTIGDACTLKYINSKWFCIGNNGCTFA